jgi:subtilisin family serine protease
MRRFIPLAVCVLAAAACDDQTAPLAPPDQAEPSMSAAALAVKVDKAGNPLSPQAIDPRYLVPGHYNVIFRQDVNARAVTAQIMNAHGLKPSHRWDEGWIKGFSSPMSDKQRDQLKRHPHVAMVNQVVMGTGATTQTYPWNWGLDRIDQRALPLNDAYVYTDSAPNVNVYILDTGIRRTHTDFGGRALLGTDIVTPGGTGNDCHGHGTFIAAIVGGTEYGVAKRSRLYAVRSSNCSNQVSSANAITAANWVTNNHRKPAVAVFSVAFPGEVPEVDQAIYASIQAGVTWVVAAGNDAKDACNHTPAHTLGTITVGATERTDTRWAWSNFGPCLNLFAPGAELESAGITDDYAYRVASGTSYAAPHVAGAAALYLGRNPTATPATVKSAVVNGATPSVVVSPGTGSPNRLLYSRF